MVRGVSGYVLGAKMTTFHEILSEIRASSLSEKEKGTRFERLMKLWFMTDPRYESLEKVWLWEEFPARSGLGGKDLGIDLVARTELGDYWAIQCKCYADDTVIDKGAVDSFLANASRSFTDPETFQTKEFSNLVWVSTSRRKWGANAETAIQGLDKFNRINIYDLEDSPVDWEKLQNDLYGNDAKHKPREPKPHQNAAIAAAEKYFVENGAERGKLIMACGTGKTYTSLRIVEKITPENATILFLVPSIALLGQTLNAWMFDKSENIKAICVCSDSKATRKMRDADELDENVVDLAVPATTNVKSVVAQIERYRRDNCRIVIFSTYQSIDVVKDAADEANLEFDFVICDEAHRTTGVILKDEKESYFTKIHKNEFIRAKKRLYMTATPRLYRESVKVKAKENDDILCSMDDPEIYGEEFHRLSFNSAVSQGLLSDYKVLVLTVSEEDIPQNIRTKIKEQYNAAPETGKQSELQFDDATKLIGCINGLSKRIKGDEGITKKQDPLMMKRAVAFCSTINPTSSNPNFSSTQIARYFSEICKEYKATLPENERDEVVNIQAEHIDGSMDANTRNERISWLKGETSDPNECRILCNVRCLSEGVDVPALDAVLFLSPRNSEVEVVQSVGRVMRSFKNEKTGVEKKYGYIIIPVIVPGDVTPEQALADNEKFKVVWTILNALRSHDENFNAHVNQIKLNKSYPAKITVAGVPRGTNEMGQYAPAVHLESGEVARQLDLQFGSLQDGIYARLVEKVGDKLYWENWAKSVGEIAQKFIERIELLIRENQNAEKRFGKFVKSLQKNINPSVDTTQAIEMLAQHLITRPVFDALFKEYKFVENNPVSRSMQDMVEILEKEGLEMETAVLDKFYTSVRNNVGNIDNLEGKQTIIKNLYEKFFKGAFPLIVEKLGIVYTPVECVDFIIKSVEYLLQKEFGSSLTNKNVHILDPFTGTGTFIARLLQSGLIKPEDMERKYREEIHCNEIVLLAYYVADVNIETVFHEITQRKDYLTYDGICLTDTFQINENDDALDESLAMQKNSARVKKQKKLPIRVIIGNPPYSIGQKSANDNAQNLKYEKLDKQIAETYVRNSSAGLSKSLYDTYIKAFRWASNCIPKDEGGIIGFITNSGWIDKAAFDGFRKCLQKEFSSIYVFNLKGAIKGKSKEAAKREGQNVFDIMTGVAITLLVRNPKIKENKIYYHDIGDYLSRKEKFGKIKDFSSVANVPWQQLTPNEKHDWINQRDGVFDNLLPLAPEKKFDAKSESFFVTYSLGCATNKDSFLYNSSEKSLKETVSSMIDYYNIEREKLAKQPGYEVTINPAKIVWTDMFKASAAKGQIFSFKPEMRCVSLYRPYFKQHFIYQKELIQRTYQQLSLFPTPTHKNLVICVSGISTRLDQTSVYIANMIVDLNCLDSGTQCFPLYWYEENKKENTQMMLFGDDSTEKYIRHDGITDWILKEIRTRYGGAKNITKEMIFYYVYGLLHSPAYRERFSADLKKSLPRIPIVENVNEFMDFYKAGKQLAELHLNYETVPAYSGVEVEGDFKYKQKVEPYVPYEAIAAQTASDDDYEFYKVEQMRFPKKDEKGTIIYNNHITIRNIPEKAYRYIVNGKSAVEWIMERYAVKIDKDSLIKNDPNDWSHEHQKPRYILDLLLSIINVSVQTVDIVEKLPKIEF